jgi:hypothetical protein
MELQEYYVPSSLVDDCLASLRPKIAGKKRKADAVEHPEAPTAARPRQLLETNEDEDAAMSFSQILEDELLFLGYIESFFGGVEPAAPKYQRPDRQTTTTTTT